MIWDRRIRFISRPSFSSFSFVFLFAFAFFLFSFVILILRPYDIPPLMIPIYRKYCLYGKKYFSWCQCCSYIIVPFHSYCIHNHFSHLIFPFQFHFSILFSIWKCNRKQGKSLTLLTSMLFKNIYQWENCNSSFHIKFLFFSNKLLNFNFAIFNRTKMLSVRKSERTSWNE